MCNMNTKSLRVASAAVIGARHTRDARNGQDAAAAWCDANLAASVVCDGCGSGASSEVGARLGARAVLRAITARLKGTAASDPRHLGFWDGVTSDVVAYLRAVAEGLGGDLEDVVHEHLLFTIVAAVVIEDTACVWSVGDGGYAIDGVVHELGPFDNNQPPYLAYELLGSQAFARAHIAPVRTSVLVATDGAAEMRRGAGDLEIARISDDPAALVANPDALRRYLAKQAKSEERIDWTAQRVIRTPALLQDDGAIGLIVREVLS
ncbi:hypothetical protein BH11MYX2_BH11MYX2_02490 [soil metagenome]